MTSPSLTLQNGILKNFQPKFKSISKDCDRYSDALFKLWEDGQFDRAEFLDLSAEGSLWIAFQYIGKGHIDLVEKDLMRDVTSRDFYGTLFENTANCCRSIS